MSSRVNRSLLLAGLLALVPAAGRSQQETGYELRPGDKVTIEVFTAAGEKVDVIAGERILDRNGDIYLPYVGTVRALDLDQASLRELLVASYKGFYEDPVVDVKVELRVNVTGAVGRPGQYFLDPSATLFDALAAAGGANVEYAVVGAQIPGNPREVQLVRGAERLTLNLHPADISDDVLLMTIRSGDWLHVPPENRTAIRDQVLFWGSLVSFATGIASLIVLTTGVGR